VLGPCRSIDGMGMVTGDTLWGDDTIEGAPFYARSRFLSLSRPREMFDPCRHQAVTIKRRKDRIGATSHHSVVPHSFLSLSVSDSTSKISTTSVARRI
jgi:hypothetical protein